MLCKSYRHVFNLHKDKSVCKLYKGYYMAAPRYEISLRVLKNIFQHEERNFVSPSDHVIFFLLYKILTIQNDMLCSLFQKLRFEIEYISLQSVVSLYQS